MKSTLSVLALLLAAPLATAQAPAPAASPSPAGAELYFIAPQDGERLRSPVTVKFGLRGMGVAPAGINLPETGHHHLLIDLAELPPLDQPIPADARHVHFGKGQTETTISLEPGTHTLQLLLGDYLHRPHQPVVASKQITITVE